MDGKRTLQTPPDRSGAAEHPPMDARCQVRSLTHEGRLRSVTTVLVLVILALIWAAVLVPPYLQNRRESRPGDSIASFRRQLNTLERTTPGSSRTNLARLDVGRYDAPRYNPGSNVAQLANRSVAGPRSAASPSAMRRAESRRRRHDIFVFLLGAVCVTLLLAVALDGAAWTLNFVVDAVFVAYVALLVTMQQQTSEREVTVRYMPQANRRPESQLALRRYGS